MARANLRTILRANRAEIVFVFMAFLLMVTTSSFFANHIVGRQVFSNVERSLVTADVSIASILDRVGFLLIDASFSLQEKLDEGASQEEVRSYIRGYSAWVSKYVSNLSGLATLLGYIRGELISGAGWAPPDGFRPQERPWYVAARENENEVVFTNPYTDPMSGKLVVSAARVLRGARGDDYGVVALDLGMSVIADYVKALRSGDGGYGILLDRDFNVIVHPDGSYFGKPLGARSLPAKLTDRSGKTVVIVYRQMENGWYIGIATPTRSYYGEIYFMILILSVLGLIFMVALSCLLIRLSMAKMRSDEESRSKSSFLARMSHEIRTPMNSILGMAELVMRQDVSSDVREYVSIIHRSGTALLSIINDILDFSKIESGQMKIESRKYQVSSLLNDLVGAIRMQVSEKRLDFFVHVDCDIPEELVGDDVKIREIALNLLSNAVKYTDEGAVSLEVRSKRTGDRTLELTLRVTDSGFGIKKEDMNRLFRDFSRLDDGYRTPAGGTGLGLVIAQNYCKLMGGDIAVSSEYGRGSTFTATLIQHFEEERNIASVEAPEQKKVLLYEKRPRYLRAILREMEELGLFPTCPSNVEEFVEKLMNGEYDCAFIASEHAVGCLDILKKMDLPTRAVVMAKWEEASLFRDVHSVILPVCSLTIANVVNDVTQESINVAGVPGSFFAPSARVLIVDDIMTNLRVAEELVSLFGVEVHTCSSGREALELVQTGHYDLVFMDHMMPGMDGVETTAAIRALGVRDERCLKVPIIALTANVVSSQKEMFLQNGMNDFLAKPIAMQKLVGILKKWIPKEKQLSVRTQGGGVRPHLESGPAVSRDILLDFCREARDMASGLGEAERMKDMEKCSILAHSLKGAAMSVGAMKAGELAAHLEKRAKNGDIAGTVASTDALLKELHPLIDEIEAALSDGSAAGTPEKSSGSKDLEPKDLKLEVLKEALVGMDIGTVNELLRSYATLPLPAKTENAVRDIEQHVLMFEYEKAIEKIDALLLPNP
ncbi:MAG: response regulator [Synergistaceae bacterium]|jgi:signal transduction histidine kinase/CheY-like chemotaxis protein|nr:response regulator [Synergistaceae bacterium]